MNRLDDAMVSLGIDVPRMMELAGLFVASAAASMAGGNKKILALSGTGNNGGDALVAARHLLNWGHRTDVALASPRLKPVPMSQWKILKKMKVKEKKKIRWNSYSLIIDGLLGYNASGDPRGRHAEMIRAANESGASVLAVDLPSGLDATTGKPGSPCIEAEATISLTAPKKGLLAKHAGKKAGKILVAYMTVPEALGRRFGIKSAFSEKNLISRLR